MSSDSCASGHAGFGGGLGRPGWPRPHVAQDALDHLLQIGLALAQVVVLHLVELARDHLQLRGQRPFGVVQALGDPLLDAVDHQLVLQQHQVHIQQRRHSPGASTGMLSSRRDSSVTTALRAARVRAISLSTCSGWMK
jgi:hypothetical protein